MAPATPRSFLGEKDSPPADWLTSPGVFCWRLEAYMSSRRENAGLRVPGCARVCVRARVGPALRRSLGCGSLVLALGCSALPVGGVPGSFARAAALCFSWAPPGCFSWAMPAAPSLPRENLNGPFPHLFGQGSAHASRTCRRANISIFAVARGSLSVPNAF